MKNDTIIFSCISDSEESLERLLNGNLSSGNCRPVVHQLCCYAMGGSEYFSFKRVKVEDCKGFSQKNGGSSFMNVS